MFESGDAEFVKMMLNVRGRPAVLKQKKGQRKVFFFIASLQSLLVLLNSFPPDKASNNSGLFAFLALGAWMYVMRLDPDIKLLKLAAKIQEKEILEQLPAAFRAMSEPMVSHDCIAFYLLSREVSKHCKVVQSGQGADELFAGYHWYPQVDGAEDPVEAYLTAFRDRSFEEYADTVQQQWV